MLAHSQQATIRQLLAMAYLVIALPAIVVVTMFVDSIDDRIMGVQSATTVKQKLAFAPASDSDLLILMGSQLRAKNLPYSVSPVLDAPLPTSAAQQLSDMRAAVIYIWVAIFLLGALVIWWLGVKLNQPMQVLTESIARLARAELIDSVQIQGPRNIREMGQGLEQLRLRLQDSDSQQRLFLRHVSHEIKTPLTSIKEGSKLLEDEILGPINSEQREITDILNKSTRELQSSIENLLNYNSAISVEKIKTRKVCDLAQLVEKVVDKQALAIRSKNLQINREISATRAFVDAEQMTTVFDNLLSNAVKFSPDNGTINLWLTQNEHSTVFTIRDYGPGVRDHNRAGIFNAFYVGDQAAHTPLKGTGLGLSIAKQYVEQHKGKIKLLKTRQGAVFQVTLSR